MSLLRSHFNPNGLSHKGLQVVDDFKERVSDIFGEYRMDGEIQFIRVVDGKALFKIGSWPGRRSVILNELTVASLYVEADEGCYDLYLSDDTRPFFSSLSCALNMAWFAIDDYNKDEGVVSANNYELPAYRLLSF